MSGCIVIKLDPNNLRDDTIGEPESRSTIARVEQSKNDNTLDSEECFESEYPSRLRNCSVLSLESSMALDAQDAQAYSRKEV